MRKIILFFTRLLSFIIPRSKHIYLFHSFPFFTDNTYAIYKYLLKNRKGRFIWVYDSGDLELAPLKEEWPVERYKRLSFKGLWYYYRASYIFCSHGLNSFIDIHQKDKIVNMWHGMPLKCIGSMDSQFNGVNPTKADYLIATSEEFQILMSKSFNNMPLEKVFVVGQPRNDMMFELTNFYQQRGINRNDYRKVGVWLPTYKQSAVGDIRSDGVFYDDGISFVRFEELEKLNQILIQNKDLIVIKLHPMDILQTKQMPNYSNILILKQKDLSCQLYPFLGSCDYLLTDYSSVWIDYEILNRPIGFVMNDIEEYSKSRGLTFKNIEKILPGPIIDNFDMLVKFCNNPDHFNYERSNLFNTYRDNKASERLVIALGI